jgi:hypothetical protein
MLPSSQLVKVFKVSGRKGGVKAQIFDFLGMSGFSIGSAETVAEASIGAVRAVLKDVAETEVIQALQNKLEENNSIFDRNLYDSFTVTVVKNEVAIASSENYGKILDEGSGPRTLTPLEEAKMPRWVVAKGIVDDSDPPGTAELVARRIQDKIEREGSDPHPFIQVTLNEIGPELEEQVRERLKDYLDFFRD